MTPDLGRLMLGAFAGLALGALYFGGLWLTVCFVGRVSRPQRLLLLSAVGRLSGVLLAFYGLLLRGWVTLAAAMAGFLAARTLWLAAKGPEEPRHTGSDRRRPHGEGERSAGAS